MLAPQSASTKHRVLLKENTWMLTLIRKSNINKIHIIAGQRRCAVKLRKKVTFLGDEFFVCLFYFLLHVSKTNMYLTTKGEHFHEIADTFYKNQDYWTFTRIQPQLTTDNDCPTQVLPYWGQRTIEPSGGDERPAQGQRWPLPPGPLQVPKSHSAHLRCTILCHLTPAPLFLSLSMLWDSAGIQKTALDAIAAAQSVLSGKGKQEGTG